MRIPPGLIVVESSPGVHELRVHLDSSKPLPPNAVDPDTVLLQLVMSLYGLVQAAHNWYHCLIQCLLKFGMTQNPVDPCLFHRFDDNNDEFHIAVFVDDIVHTGSDHLHAQFESLLDQHFKCTHDGRVSWLLAMKVDFPNEHTITFSQRKYINDVLDRFGMSNCNPLSTPSSMTRLTSDMSPKSPDEVRAMQDVPYRQLVGSLMYVLQTRPDVAYSVQQCARFMHNPGQQHWIAAKRILRYLKGTIDHNLTFDTSAPLSLYVHVDSDWGGDETRRSLSGYIAFLGDNNAISYKCKLQHTIAYSSAEAELYAFSEATREALFLRHLLQHFRIDTTSPTPIFIDNTGAAQIILTGSLSSRSKHIDLQRHCNTSYVNDGSISVHRIQSSSNLSDIFTKPTSDDMLSVFVPMVFTSPK